MTKRWKLVLAVCASLALLLFAACESTTTESSDGDLERSSCVQATDCGSEGRAGWVCSPEGECFSVAEYCYSDDECDGACVDHVCENGKLNADGDNVDGDVDGDSDAHEGPCTQQCCKDEDCPQGSHCDLNNLICVLNNACTYVCCSTTDCVESPTYGPGYVCRFNECVLEDAPCETECCDDSDCDPGFTCQLGTCVEQRISCNPGDETCCSSKPTLTACVQQGDQASETRLICNGAGDGYTLQSCPQFNDCIDMGDGTSTCFPNGRCLTDADCPCPQVCLDGDNGLRCQAPRLNPGDACYGEAPDCDNVEGPVELGRCPDNTSCCYDNAVNPTSGTCQAECP
jgi:hypothetical protein